MFPVQFRSRLWRGICLPSLRLTLAAVIFASAWQGLAAAPRRSAPASAAASAPKRSVPAPKSDQPKIAVLLEQVPAQNAKEQERISKELAALGPEGLRALCGMLAPPEQGGDAKARMALHGLALYVAGPGAEIQRRTAAASLAEALQSSEIPKAVQAFLVEQLRIVGGQEAVEPLGRLLLDDTLCEPAAQALLTIGGQASAAAFRKALPEAKDNNRATIIKALGDFRDAQAAPALLKDAESPQPNVRLAALRALANIGDPAAADALEKAANAAPPSGEASYERDQATKFLLLFAQRLAEAGRAEQAARICRKLIQTRAESGERQEVAAALRTLAQALGIKAVGDLVSAMNNPDPQIRCAAAEFGLEIPGEAATREWLGAMQSASPLVRAEILSMLGRRGDATALPAAREALKDAEKPVRLAAISTVGALGREDALADLTAAAAGADDEQRGAVEQALIQIPGDRASEMMTAALSKAPAGARVALLNALAGRNAIAQLKAIQAQAKSEEEPVRIAALNALGVLSGAADAPALLELLGNAKSPTEREAGEKAVVSVFRRVGDQSAVSEPTLQALAAETRVPARCSFLRVLGKVGGPQALEGVRAALQEANSEVKDAAVRSLADWPDAAAAQDLLEIARGDPAEVSRVLALRGYVRVVGLPGKRPVKETLTMYQEAMGAARRVEDKKMVLGAIAEMKSPPALDLIETYIAEESLRAEAMAAATTLILGFLKPNLEAAKAGMEKMLAAAEAKSLSPEAIDAAIQVAVAARGAFPQEAKAMIEKALAAGADESLRKSGQDAIQMIAQQADWITAWQVAGPFTERKRKSGRLLDAVFPPEEPGAKGVRWRLMPLGSDPAMPGLLDLGYAIGGDNRAAYLRTRIWAPKEQEAAFQIGHDDGAKLWLNGQPIYAENASKGLSPRGGQTVKAPLLEGWNELMIKVVQTKSKWGACLQIHSPEGGPIEGLRAEP